jgi:hypothetical protein
MTVQTGLTVGEGDGLAVHLGNVGVGQRYDRVRLVV